jgi:hypothetical protein
MKLGLHHQSEIVTIHRPQPVSTSMVKIPYNLRVWKETVILPPNVRRMKWHNCWWLTSAQNGKENQRHTGKNSNTYGYVPWNGRAVPTGYSFRPVLVMTPRLPQHGTLSDSLPSSVVKPKWMHSVRLASTATGKMVTSTNPRQFPPQWSIHYAFKEGTCQRTRCQMWEGWDSFTIIDGGRICENWSRRSVGYNCWNNSRSVGHQQRGGIRNCSQNKVYCRKNLRSVGLPNWLAMCRIETSYPKTAVSGSFRILPKRLAKYRATRRLTYLFTPEQHRKHSLAMSNNEDYYDSRPTEPGQVVVYIEWCHQRVALLLRR